MGGDVYSFVFSACRSHPNPQPPLFHPRNNNNNKKQVLAYISASRSRGASVAVTHIAVAAVARALSEHRIFNGRYVRMPLIGVEGYYPNATVDVSTAAGSMKNGGANIVKVRAADKMSVAEVAGAVRAAGDGAAASSKPVLPWLLRRPMEIMSDQLDLPVPGLGLEGRRFGGALVVTSPDSNDSEVSISADLHRPKPGMSTSGPSVILVVGGVRVRPSLAGKERGGKAVARPVLGVTMTVGCEVANVASVRVLAERVQRIMRDMEGFE